MFAVEFMIIESIRYYIFEEQKGYKKKDRISWVKNYICHCVLNRTQIVRTFDTEKAIQKY